MCLQPFHHIEYDHILQDWDCQETEKGVISIAPACWVSHASHVTSLSRHGKQRCQALFQVSGHLSSIFRATEWQDLPFARVSLGVEKRLHLLPTTSGDRGRGAKRKCWRRWQVHLTIVQGMRAWRERIKYYQACCLKFAQQGMFYTRNLAGRMVKRTREPVDIRKEYKETVWGNIWFVQETVWEESEWINLWTLWTSGGLCTQGTGFDGLQGLFKPHIWSWHMYWSSVMP